MKFKWLEMGTGSKNSNGSFSNKGNWKLMKAFYKENGRQGEFFINLNPLTGEGEIIFKDRISYGEALAYAFSEEMAGKVNIEFLSNN